MSLIPKFDRSETDADKIVSQMHKTEPRNARRTCDWLGVRLDDMPRDRHVGEGLSGGYGRKIPGLRVQHLPHGSESSRGEIRLRADRREVTDRGVERRDSVGPGGEGQRGDGRKNVRVNRSATRYLRE